MALFIMLYLGTLESNKKALGTSRGEEETRRASKSCWRPNSSQSRPSRPPGTVCTKIISQATNGLHFQLSTYAWKDKNIIFPMPPVRGILEFGVDGKSCWKLTNRICLGCWATTLGHWAMYHVRVY